MRKASRTTHIQAHTGISLIEQYDDANFVAEHAISLDDPIIVLWACCDDDEVHLKSIYNIVP